MATISPIDPRHGDVVRDEPADGSAGNRPGKRCTLGRLDAALPLLRKATTRCEGVLYPYEQTRAFLWTTALDHGRRGARALQSARLLTPVMKLAK